MRTFFLIIFVSCVFCLVANPIMPGPAINEIFFNENGWQIEIISINLEGNLDLCAISGINGFSEFNTGITFDDNDLVVVTMDDLLNPFEIDAECDSVLTYWNNLPFCYCEYGTIDDNILNPLPGQSLRLEWFYSSQTSAFVRYCKDDSPTIGAVNDTTDYKGWYSGRIRDAQLNPVPNALISYEPSNFNDPEIYSNPYGLYAMFFYALNNQLQISVNNVVYLDTLLSVEPGIYFQNDFILEDYIPNSSDDNEISLPASFYNLSNYPNPFNPSTEISFQISDFNYHNLEIQIFNSKGQKVANLPITQSQNHQISVEWDGANSTGKSCPSGVYLYKLVSGEKELAANKMLLLK